MADRIALKSLTASDLTFFEAQFRKLGAGNQKAINLNADVFVEELYPALPGLVPTVGDVLNVSLFISGPAGAKPHLVSRAITKREAYKNWRLNGEFVRDPEGQAGRFDALMPGDLAVFEFVGDPLPQKLNLLLVAAAVSADAALHNALKTLVPGGRKTMSRITREQVAEAAKLAASDHPITLFAADAEYDAAVEDAALGGISGTKTLATKKATKPVSAAALASAKTAAEKIGKDGEALAWVHIQKLAASGYYTSTEWSSQANAVSPYDFRVTDSGGNSCWMDAKSTAGEFSRIIHMSAAELEFASKCGRYDLWRVYEINGEGAKLRVAENIGMLAKTVLDGLKLPSGITVDSVSIEPSSPDLNFGEEIVVVRPDEPSTD